MNDIARTERGLAAYEHYISTTPVIDRREMVNIIFNAMSEEQSRRTGAASPTSRLVTEPETILTSGSGSLREYPHDEIKQSLDTYNLMFTGPSTAQGYDTKLNWLMEAVALLLKAHQ